MKQKLVFLTTAITRQGLHQATIGKFYKEYFHLLERDYEIHHIINIDMPLKLRTSKFSYTRTKQLFNKIIPMSVKRYYIINKNDPNPSFTKAYNNVIAYYKTMIASDINTIIWWLEDDWEVIKNTDFTPLFKLLNMNKNVALSICEKAPLCSFRAGPVMNTKFYETFFVNKNLAINPEKKVYNNLIYNNRIIEYNDIVVVCIFLLEECEFPFKMESCQASYYKRYLNTAKFKENKTIKYILGVISNTNYEKMYFKENNDYNLLYINCEADLKNYKTIPTSAFENYIPKDSSIVYISLLPYIFQDVGRSFNTLNNLQSPTK